MTDDELAAIADPEWEQYFLVSPTKIALLLEAAGIRSTDRVIEIGAGVGTVARHVPPCASLTVVELDERLIPYLRANVPHANVVQADGVTLLETTEFDVLLSNLPTEVTENELAPALSRLRFRSAVLAVDSATDLNALAGSYDIAELTTITGDDFRPPQPSVSRLVKLSPVHSKAGIIRS